MSRCVHCKETYTKKYCQVKEREVVETECKRCPLYLDKLNNVEKLFDIFSEGLKESEE